MLECPQIFTPVFLGVRCLSLRCQDFRTPLLAMSTCHTSHLTPINATHPLPEAVLCY